MLGSFCTNIALALRNLNRIPEALKYYESARYYHQKSGHRIYLGTIENNLAYLYKSQRRFKEAHSAIDNGVGIFKKLKDRTREGFSLDTKAQIFCDEGKYKEALKVIEKAIFILSKSENADYLTETYLSKSKFCSILKILPPRFFVCRTLSKLLKTRLAKKKPKIWFRNLKRH